MEKKTKDMNLTLVKTAETEQQSHFDGDEYKNRLNIVVRMPGIFAWRGFDSFRSECCG